MDIHFDTVVRLMAIGALTLLLVVLVAGQVQRPLKIAMAGILIGSVGYLINTSTFLPVPRSAGPFLDLVSLSTTIWTWLFARWLFERDPPRLIILGIAVIYLTGWYIARFMPSIWLVGFYLLHILSLMLVVNLIYVALSGLSDDLVSKRRLVRIYLPLLIGLQVGGVLTYELIVGPSGGGPIIQTINASLIFTLILFASLALLQTDPELLSAPNNRKEVATNQLSLSPSETVLHEKLNNAMSGGQYRSAGLTIQRLAEHLSTPEHRLRALINQKLGHRNFSSFLNGYRITEAKEKLADRELVSLPILTIAMDLGYNSLAPFNRAFRAETGVTPSDFRKTAIDQN